MPNVTCPSCGEKGKIPSTLIGTRIKCRKCGTAFLVGPAGSKTETPAPPPTAAAPAQVAARVATAVGRRGDDDTIQVEGLDDSAWATTTVAPVEHEPEHEHEAASGAFDPHHETGDHKHYKLVTPKDKYFEGKFELDKLEEYLNLLARQGWVVRGMATPHVNIFGSEKEQLVVLLER
ncbi:MAG: hypothetical protein U0794_13830 [Isosphaeraceae bacterium]